MPKYRSRLRNPGLKLKIPSRSFSGGSFGVANNNFAGGNATPYDRHSASPKISSGGGRPPRWSSSSPGGNISSRRRLPPSLGGRRRTVTFADRMDTDDRPNDPVASPVGRAEDDFSQGRCESIIPIQIVRDQRPTFNVMIRTSYRGNRGANTPVGTQPPVNSSSLLPAKELPPLPKRCSINCESDDDDDNSDSKSEPESPVIEIDLTPPPPASFEDPSTPLPAVAISRGGGETVGLELFSRNCHFCCSLIFSFYR